MLPQKVSIVIPCYNDKEYVVQAIDYARNESWMNKEVIVVDDGSNSQTKKILEEYRGKVDHLIIQKNKGTSAARNIGIETATGDYILVLDSDDYFEPAFCTKAIDVFQKHLDCKIVTCYSRWFADDKNFKLYKPKGGYLKDVLIDNIAMGSSMFRKKDWAQIGGYDEKMTIGFEDWEFYLRLLSTGGYAHVIPEILFHYRSRPHSRNRRANKIKYDILKYIYLKHEDLYKENFAYFIGEWLKRVKRSEEYKQQVMDSLDYKIGAKILKPLRYLGLFSKNRK